MVDCFEMYMMGVTAPTRGGHRHASAAGGGGGFETKAHLYEGGGEVLSPEFLTGLCSCYCCNLRQPLTDRPSHSLTFPGALSEPVRRSLTP